MTDEGFACAASSAFYAPTPSTVSNTGNTSPTSAINIRGSTAACQEVETVVKRATDLFRGNNFGEYSLGIPEQLRNVCVLLQNEC